MYGFVLHSLLLQHLGKVWQVMSVSDYRCSYSVGWQKERERCKMAFMAFSLAFLSQ